VQIFTENVQYLRLDLLWQVVFIFSPFLLIIVMVLCGRYKLAFCQLLNMLCILCHIVMEIMTAS